MRSRVGVGLPGRPGVPSGVWNLREATKRRIANAWPFTFVAPWMSRHIIYSAGTHLVFIDAGDGVFTKSLDLGDTAVVFALGPNQDIYTRNGLYFKKIDYNGVEQFSFLEPQHNFSPARADVDPNGNMIVAFNFSSSVGSGSFNNLRWISSDYQTINVTSVGGRNGQVGMLFLPDGTFYHTHSYTWDQSRVRLFQPSLTSYDSSNATWSPAGLTVDGVGNAYLLGSLSSSSSYYGVRKYASVSSIAWSQTSSLFGVTWSHDSNRIRAASVSPSQDVVVIDAAGNIITLNPDGSGKNALLAEVGANPSWIEHDRDGNYYIACSNPGRVVSYDADNNLRWTHYVPFMTTEPGDIGVNRLVTSDLRMSAFPTMPS